jgi:hypothetical protein
MTKKNLTRRTYGYINGTIVGIPYPLALGAFQSNNTIQGAVHLINNFSAYTRCLMDVEISDQYAAEPATVIKRIGFISLENIVEWINTNVANDGAANFTQACKIHVYDEIDADVPPISKVYGKNTRRASLGRSGWYYSSAGRATVSQNWGDAAAYLDAIWTELYSASLNPGGPGTWTDDDYECFWFSGGRSTFYACPTPSLVSVSFSSVGGNGRHMKRLSDGLRVSATATTWDMSSGSYEAQVVMNSKNGAIINFKGIGESSKVIEDWQRDYTMMIAYPMEDSSGNMSVLLKPLGVDSFYFNYFDRGKYRLEMVSSKGPQSSWHRLFTLDALSSESSPENNSIGPIEMGPMISTLIQASKFSHRRYKPADMYFHLRNMQTNKVSPISPQFVQWTTHRGAATIAPLVRTRPQT